MATCEGRKGNGHREDAKYAGARKEKGRLKKRWIYNMRDDMKVYQMTGDMADNLK